MLKVVFKTDSFLLHIHGCLLVIKLQCFSPIQSSNHICKSSPTTLKSTYIKNIKHSLYIKKCFSVTPSKACLSPANESYCMIFPVPHLSLHVNLFMASALQTVTGKPLGLSREMTPFLSFSRTWKWCPDFSEITPGKLCLSLLKPIPSAQSPDISEANCHIKDFCNCFWYSSLLH